MDYSMEKENTIIRKKNIQEISNMENMMDLEIGAKDKEKKKRHMLETSVQVCSMVEENSQKNIGSINMMDNGKRMNFVEKEN